MAERRPRTEKNVAKDEADAADPSTAMDRFRSLARKLVKVPREELERQRRQHEAAKAAKSARHR
jgi:hypothetical protein